MPSRRSRQPDETLVDQLEKIVGALADHDRNTAAREMDEIKYERPEVIEGRIQLTPYEQAAVFWRDSFICRYCGRRTVPHGLLSLVTHAFPKEFPEASRRADTHLAFWTIYTSCDHIVPGTRGGPWRDPENLATACWTCQSLKADHLLEEMGWSISKPPRTTRWDGLVRIYPQLWEALGSPYPDFNKRWLRAFEWHDPENPEGAE